jgi:uncharacterized protein (DUF4415 family)
MRQPNTTKDSRTDWRKLATLPDDSIDTSDVPELDEAFFREAHLRLPKGKQLVSLRMDRDVLDWFKRQGKGYQSKINAVLRAYVRAQGR